MRKTTKAISLLLGCVMGAIGIIGNPISVSAANEYKNNNEVIIKFQDGIYEDKTLSQTYEIEQIDSEFSIIRFDTQSELQKSLVSLTANNKIDYVQPNYEYENQEAPNDTYFEYQWGLLNPGAGSFPSTSTINKQAVSGMDIGAVDAWASYTSTRKVIVAVIDTGIDYQHEDLASSMWVNSKEIPGNGIDDDKNGYIDDVYGWDFYNDDETVCSYGLRGGYDPNDDDTHGTHIAGIIAATKDNGVGVAGVASNTNVKIMSLKALGGKSGEGTTYDLIKAIQYAQRNGASIVNASWGGQLDSTMSDTALKSVIKNSNMLFITAAGNENSNNDSVVSIPAAYSSTLTNVISVGSIDCDGIISSFSNYGSSVNMVAPGGGIYSTVIGGYGLMSGTSMATPMVTGVAAMLYSTNSKLYPKTVKQLMLASCKPVSTVSSGKTTSNGIIDAYNAITSASSLKTDTKKPTITLKKSKRVVKVTAKDTGGSGICITKYAKGTRTAANFAKGTKGTTVNNGKFTAPSAGVYTVYTMDRAGNQTIKRITVK